MENPLTYEIETVTPAFPGGPDHRPDPKDAADFEGMRPTSIVYGMRWWFRALAGALLGTENLAGIRDAESRVFGTVHSVEKLHEKGSYYKGLRSRVRVAVTGNAAGQPFEDRDIWLRYLAYGMYPTKSSEPWRRRFIAPSEKLIFEVMVLSPTNDYRLEIPRALVDSLVRLWVQFGGLGARWRHGFGAMRMAREPLPQALEYGRQAARQIVSAREQMRDFLTTLGHSMPAGGTQGNALPTFAVASEGALRLAWRDDAGSDWRPALRTVFNLWRDGRLKEPGNPRSSTWNSGLYAAFLRGESLTGQKAELAGLGLPIPFGFPLGGTGIQRGATGVLKPERSERRGSPIWFRPVRVARGGATGFGLFALFWNSQYLDTQEGVVLADTKGGRTERLAYDPKDAEHWFEHFLLRPSNRFRRV